MIKHKVLKPGMSGMSLLEIIISSAVLGVIIVGVGAQMQNVKKRLEALRQSQTGDVLEASLFNVMKQSANVEYSIKQDGAGELKSCMSGLGACSHKKEYEFAFYLEGEKTPLTGSSVYYDRDGDLCKEASCRTFQVTSFVQTLCPITLAGPLPTCSKPANLAIRFDVMNLKTGKKQERESVEVIPEKTGLATNVTLKCPAGQIMRGIGFSGAPLCTKLSDVKYTDADTLKAGVLAVKPKDCRATQKVKETQTQKQKVIQKDAAGNDVEVEVDVQVEVEVEKPIDGDDSGYVAAIKKNGDIECGKKFW